MHVKQTTKSDKMDNINSSTENQITENLLIPNEILPLISETSKWTKFLAILGFIGVAFMVILGIFSGSIMSAIPGQEMNQLASSFGFVYALFYLITAVLYVFPSLYLLRFSNNMKTALISKSYTNINDALANLKSFFKFWGILSIILIGFYLVVGLVTLLTFSSF